MNYQEKKKIQKEYDQMLKSIERRPPYDCRPEIHIYKCEKCGAMKATFCDDLGVTPFSLPCKCHGISLHVSTFKNTTARRLEVEKIMPTDRWVRPTIEEAFAMRPAMRQHVLNGGLILASELNRQEKP